MENEIKKAIEVLNAGGVILYPTDTIWGLGCDPNNDDAIKKINAIKNRPEGKHFIILVDSERLLNRYVKTIPEVCYDLLDYANKPLTIIYPNGQYLSPLVLGDDKSIGIRMVKEGFSNELIRRFKKGLVSTSANVSGEKSPTNFEDISDVIKNSVDYVVNLPTLKSSGSPSQIIKIGENSEVTIIRK